MLLIQTSQTNESQIKGLGVLAVNNYSLTTSNKDMENICKVHNDSFEFICYPCHRLMCKRCLRTHLKQFNDHIDYWDNIQDIRESFYKILYNNSNTSSKEDINVDDNYDQSGVYEIGEEEEVLLEYNDGEADNDHDQTEFIEEEEEEVGDQQVVEEAEEENQDNEECADYDINLCFIERTINYLWNSIKKSTFLFKSMDTSEKLITEHFKILHDFLINEEHKLKSPITKDKNITLDDIDQKTTELNQIVRIIKLNNSIYNNQKSGDGEEEKEESSDGDDDDQKYCNDDTTLPTALEIIDQSETFQQYAQYCVNNEYICPDIDIEHQNKQFHNNSDFIILDTIAKYNNEFNTATYAVQQTVDEYFITVEPTELETLQQALKNTISISTSQQPIANPSPIYYYLSTHKESISLYNHSVGTLESIKDTKNYRFEGTSRSTVAVGNHIYIFGGVDGQKYCRFSLDSISIDLIEDIDPAVICGKDRLAVYDGGYYIYILGGVKRIIRFNLKKLKFENFMDTHTVDICQAFFVKEKLIIFGSPNDRQNRLNRYGIDVTTGSHFRLDWDLGVNITSVCYDGYKSLYFVSGHRFYRYNTETNQKQQLKEFASFRLTKDGFGMIYSKISDKESYVYAVRCLEIRSNIFRHYRYSIENDCWEIFIDTTNHGASALVRITSVKAVYIRTKNVGTKVFQCDEAEKIAKQINHQIQLAPNNNNQKIGWCWSEHSELLQLIFRKRLNIKILIFMGCVNKHLFLVVVFTFAL
ncbi:hypothetical protein PPL_08766 [Heterostelium album PN500]|uniref:B box-type domain-containing protein n=1 Tax=Heterostelium pallidum (strain ATCC 26659 / Pp 5 / PN500) TaxID=670386 RepID=D3BJN8_HETP5|nr:hypothetical protein PPL_08766 [Heterostelium album PN500]EFA78118.1 hypothetical protein PPL_08766 [Heterostelium album PN500]|eukprot:XP_020430244.1 hypothetical protein PPL_08766 [Heterostelium album PN500]